MLLGCKFFSKSLLCCGELLFRGIKSLHFFGKNSIDWRNVSALVVELCCKGGKLVTQNCYFTGKRLFIFLSSWEFFTDFCKFTFLCLNLTFGSSVVIFFTFKTLLVLLKIILFSIKLILEVTEGFTSLIDEFVTSTTVFYGVLPLEVELMTFLMETFEFFRSFIKFNLSSLSFGNLLLKLLALVTDFNGQLFNLKGQFLDFSLISSAVLLKGKIILFLLSGGECPLFKFLLIPVHL